MRKNKLQSFQVLFMSRMGWPHLVKVLRALQLGARTQSQPKILMQVLIIFALL